MPSGTIFRSGETLRLEISGRYRGGDGVVTPYGFTDTVNRGIHSIYTGGKFDSYLLIPLVPPNILTRLRAYVEVKDGEAVRSPTDGVAL